MQDCQTTKQSKLLLSGYVKPHAQGMHRACTGHAQGMHRACTGHAQGMHRACTGHAQGMHRACTGHAHDIHIPMAPQAKMLIVFL